MKLISLLVIRLPSYLVMRVEHGIVANLGWADLLQQREAATSQARRAFARCGARVAAAPTARRIDNPSEERRAMRPRELIFHLACLRMVMLPLLD